MGYAQQLYFGNVALDRSRDRKMCFYGRVSTQHEEQLDALGNQMQWYDDQLKYHPNWNVVARYIDEGITGTLAKKRPLFMRMIEDAKARKFDLIVTREVCRFARNTVDTLVLTRELKEYGIEVFFVEDNIWTMDGDGELRLTIMATLAQEESRKISERVRVGQMVSRENGVLYGNGNIIRYDRDKANRTYVINEEQAETVRLVFTLYAQGQGEKQIVNELCRRGFKDGKGNVKWSCPKVSKMPRNATYMGYIGYNKSKVNNFLEKKRIKNLDDDSIVYVKGDFEPIVSEELWYECERIRKSRISQYRLPDSETRRKGTYATKDLWVSKLRCKCGASFRKFKWNKHKDGTQTIGYQCCKRTQYASKSFREENSMTVDGACDQISLCDWKLELMAKRIFEQIWGEQKDAVLRACQLVETGLAMRQHQQKCSADAIQQKIDAAKKRKPVYSRMRADDELEKDEYKELCGELKKELAQLETQMQQVMQDEPVETNSKDMQRIRKALERMVDTSGPKISAELLDEFVEVVTPITESLYRWKLNFGERKAKNERTDMMAIQQPPTLTFRVDYEAAHQFRAKCGLPIPQFRRSAWYDLEVEVYL